MRELAERSIEAMLRYRAKKLVEQGVVTESVKQFAEHGNKGRTFATVTTEDDIRELEKLVEEHLESGESTA